VRKSGTRVRITAQLIQVATDSHLWSKTYDRQLDDIFAMQDDIARSVVKELRATLLPAESDPPDGPAVDAEVQAARKGRSENAEAYRLYLQGRFLVERRTQPELTKGIAYLRQATDLDPAYALAWAALSYALAIEAGAWTQYDQGFEGARKAAERALALEPNLAEAHVALGAIQSAYDRDWAGADASVQRALASEPENVGALLAAARDAAHLGRYDESIALARRAIAIDPLNVRGHRYVGIICHTAGLLAQSEEAFKEAIELGPEGGMAHFGLGLIYLEQGRPTEALAEFEKESHEGFHLLGQAVACHALGENARSTNALAQLSALSPHLYLVAKAHAYRGEIDEAFAWLERAYAQRNSGLSEMRDEMLLRNLHADPRWRVFLHKMRLAG
jgi:tetratricopeptide (TPR) repeat protein